MTRLVLDTNVYVSALVFGGKPLAVLRLVESGPFQLVVSAQIKEELLETLTRKFGWPARQAARACRGLWEAAYWAAAPNEVAAARDPEDNPILACALEGRAEVIVTGDRDLLVLHPFQGVGIVSPAEFLQRWRRE